MEYHVISADNHITEPPGTFIDRVPSHLKDRAPRIVRGEDGGDGWSFDGRAPGFTFGAAAQTGGRSSGESRFQGLKFEEIRPGNYDGTAHIEDMDLDGIDAATVYPLAAAATYSIEDRELGLACVRAYNDWMIDEFCAVNPERLLSMCLIPVDDDIEEMKKEVARVVEKGARVLFLPFFSDTPYWDTHYDPIWSIANEAKVPVTIHREHGGKRGTQEGARGFGGKALPKTGPEAQALHMSNAVMRFYSALSPITDMIFTGVFDRFPDLKMVNGESNFGWLPFWCQTMDEQWALGNDTGWNKVPAKRPPSTYVGDNIFVTVLDDALGFSMAHENLMMQNAGMYSTDYPHSITTWPNSKELIERLTKGMTDEAKHKILAGNAVRVYNLAD
jgi:predicted TIM-barrel fold metal-dependent hydrolase